MQSPSYPNLPDSALGKIRDRISYNRDGADKVAKTESMRMREVADVLDADRRARETAHALARRWTA